MINIDNVTFTYPKGDKPVLHQLNMNIADGEFLCIIGHSGCGKSTLLRLVAGLDVPQEGNITMNGKPLNGPGTDRSLVFQQYSLFPWLTVKKMSSLP